MTNIAVNSTAIVFSPGNWKGDTGRGGSVYRQTWNNGAYFRFTFTASGSPTATILLPSSSTGSSLDVYVNGKQTIYQGSAGGNLSISGLVANIVNNIVVIVDASPQSSRWNNGTNIVQVQGITIDNSSTPGVASTNSHWVLIVGDSITEGIQANAGNASNVYDYSYFIGQALLNAGFDYCTNACGYSGWIEPGDSTGDVPAFYYVNSSNVYQDSMSRWNKIDQGVSVLDGSGQYSSYGASGTPPSGIFINLGTNEEVLGGSIPQMQASIQQCLTALRIAAPAASITVCIPFGLYYTPTFTNGPAYITAIKAAVATHSADRKIFLLDLTATLSNLLATSGYTNDGVHPVLIGHANIAPKVLEGFLPTLIAASGAGNLTGPQALAALGALARTVHPPFLTQNQTGMYINNNQLVIPESAYNTNLGTNLVNSADSNNIYLGLNIGDPASGA